MEEEKLFEAKNTFDEDCDKFDRYLEDLTVQANDAKERVNN